MMKKTNRADMCVNMWYPASTIKNEETTSCEGGNGREREREREERRVERMRRYAPKHHNQGQTTKSFQTPIWPGHPSCCGSLFPRQPLRLSFFTSSTLSAAGSLLAHAPEEVHNLLRATRASLVTSALFVVCVCKAPTLL